MANSPVKVRLYLTGGQVVETHDHELSEDEEIAMDEVGKAVKEGRWQVLGDVWFHTQSISAVQVNPEGSDE